MNTTPHSPLVSIIILNYNGMHHLKECLESVLQTNYPRYEVIFVDNNSSDGSMEFVLTNILPSYVARKIPLKTVRSSRNLGFARGNNLGIKYSKGEYVVFLNNDTKVDPYWISELVKVMEKDPTIGIAQCKTLKYGSEKIIDSVGINLYLTGMSTTLGHGELDRGQYNHVHEIPAAHAGIAIFRRSVLETVGGFDPDFFIMREDNDISLRTWLSGWRIVLVPQSIVYHKGGGTITRFMRTIKLYYMIRNSIAFIIKNYEMRSIIIYLPLSIFMYFAKCAMLLARHRSEYFYAYVKAVLWVLPNLRVILKKRRTVQNLRKVSDKKLIIMQILNRPTLKSLYISF